MSATQATIRAGHHPSLTEIRQRTLHPVDAWWPVLVVDPIAIRLLWVLVRVWPNAAPITLTWFNLLAGLAAAFAFYRGELIWGGVLSFVAYLLDCMDGKLARLKRVVSGSGAFWDGMADRVVFSVGILAFALSPHYGPEVTVLGCALLAISAIQSYVEQHIKVAETGSWSTFTPGRESWLRRHRLMWPMTNLDRKAVLLTIGPITGLVTEAFLFCLLAAVPLLVMRIWKLQREQQAAVVSATASRTES